jgi:hypothetical protein
METGEKKIKEIRKVETVISENLFLVCTLVTLATMVMMTVNFFSRGSFLPTSIGFFYLIVVLIYSLHKEFVRWIGEKQHRRRGEYFVYGWIILTTALYVINFFSNNYFGVSAEGTNIPMLADIAYVTVEVLGVFVITRIMKIFFIIKK